MAFRFTVIATLLFSAVPVLAQDASPQSSPVDRNSLTLGIGGGVSPEFDGSSDYRFQPGGLIRGEVDGFEFTARGTNLYFDLIREPRGAKVNLIVGPLLQLRLERTGKISDPRIAAFGKRKAAFEIGGYVGIGVNRIFNPYDSLTFDAGVVKDVTSVHDSVIISPGIAYVTPLSRSAIARLGVSADYVGRGYGRTYFDVPVVSGSAPALTPYTTKGSGFKSIGTTFLLVKALEANPRKGWSLFALTGYSRLLGQYAASPIVKDAGKPGQFLGVAGIAYTF
jgi:MipA family protein